MDFNKRPLMYIAGLIALREEDIWLPSFPRAGSTWVRFLLSNLISLTELDGQIVDYKIAAEIMPSLGRSNLHKSWNFKSSPRFIKTHQPYRRFLFDITQRVAYIIRDPRDIMVSYFHYRKTRRKNPFQGNFTEFIRHPKYGLRACIQHYVTWRPHITHLIRYEKLKCDPSSEIRKIIHIFGLEAHEKYIEIAVHRSSFDQMRAFAVQRRHAKRSSQDGFITARKGQTNQWPEYFSDKDLNLYQQLCRELNFNLSIECD
jgi:hypothetical protein